ncbi:unnamed protein product [Tuber melanosporum]|uniref:(Perigord truffle) hypothetical protein n=1 Tax=Tuber melanosporum (strain Mel28) TaxID=656061 RepID=D5GC40_TUBMM|nr:uncharacterized protein GSTUM_00000552001 [Tuber melanosporum]CAZ82083.1 unnamed protein product [Tuber melanosporum]
MDQQPPISRLPPELLVRILTFVGLTGGPPALRSCLLVCRGFYGVIEDPTLDKHIYRAAAFSLLSYDPLLFPPSTLSGTRVPPTSVTPSARRQTYKALARNLFLSRQRFPPEVHRASVTHVPKVCLATSYGPNPGNRGPEIEDAFCTATLSKNEMKAGTLPPLSVDPAGRKVVRIIDFVHSCTEASRTYYNVAYVGVKTCGWSDSLPPGIDTTVHQGETANWILFSDDPRSFPESRDGNTITVQRAAIVGGAPPHRSGSPLATESQACRRMEEETEGSKLLRVVEAPAPPSLVELVGQQQRVKSPFIRPVDHDKFINSQKWGPPGKSIHASIYRAFGTQDPRKKHESKDQIGRHVPPESGLTSEEILWTMDKVADAGLIGFGKSLLHSDANLRLVPRLVKKQVEVAAVERLAMVSSDKNEVVVNMVWKMPGSIKDLSLDSATSLDSDEMWDDDAGDIKVCWEFRSCGAYLIVCDDSSGRRASTVSCFAGRVSKVSGSSGKPSPSAPASGLRWQRRMVVKPSVSSAEYWLDNDGLAVNSSVCAYSTRRHITPATNSNPERYRAVMEFHLLSLQTGDTVKILNLAEEERNIIRQCYMWCSFTLGDGVLIASLGGLGSAARPTDEDGYWGRTGRRRRYGYENVFVWDLGSEPDPTPDAIPAVGPFRGDIKGEAPMTRPTSRIPVPRGWGNLDKYVVLSGCGRYLGVTAEWKTAVWDLEERSFVGVWGVENADALQASLLSSEDGCPAWNGLWIKWRDVTYLDDTSDPDPVASGMSYISARDLRCAIGGVDMEIDGSQIWVDESESDYEGEDGSTYGESDEDSNYTTSGPWNWWGPDGHPLAPPAPAPLQQEGGEASNANAPSGAPLADSPEDLIEVLGIDGGGIGYMGWAS